VSAVVGVRDDSTFEAVAYEITVCASATRRKPRATSLFAAAVTTQT